MLGKFCRLVDLIGTLTFTGRYLFRAGGSLPVCFSYFSEFQPKEKRGAMISALATSWMAGNIFAAGKFCYYLVTF